MPCRPAKSAARPALREPTAPTVPAVKSATASASLLAIPPGAMIPHRSGGASCGSGTRSDEGSGMSRSMPVGQRSAAVGLLVGGHQQVHERERLAPPGERVAVERGLGRVVADPEALLEQPAPLGFAHRERPLARAALGGDASGGEHV